MTLKLNKEKKTGVAGFVAAAQHLIIKQDFSYECFRL